MECVKLITVADSNIVSGIVVKDDRIEQINVRIRRGGTETDTAAKILNNGGVDQIKVEFCRVVGAAHGDCAAVSGAVAVERAVYCGNANICKLSDSANRTDRAAVCTCCIIDKRAIHHLEIIGKFVCIPRLDICHCDGSAIGCFIIDKRGVFNKYVSASEEIIRNCDGSAITV